jgi:RNA polymerase primary sigma factor
MYEKTQRIAQAARAFEHQHGQDPTVEEIAALVGLPITKVLSINRIALEPLSIHEIERLDEQIASEAKDQYTARDPMDIAEDKEMIGAIDRFFEALKPKEAQVLRMRFGLGIDTQEPIKLDDIGKRLDVTHERIRQIEAAALRKLKHPSRLELLRRELNGSQPQRGEGETPPHDDSDDETDAEASAVPEASAPRPIPATQAAPIPERPNGASPAALEELLDHVRAIGFGVEDYREGPDRRIWAHITDTPDNHSRKIVRKLVDLGFVFWPGKGYWR